MADELLQRVRHRPFGGPPIADILDFVSRKLNIRHQRELEHIRATNAQSTWRRIVEPDPPNVESLLRAIDRLEGRRGDELNEFVSAWDPELPNLASRARDFSKCREALEQALVECVWPRGADTNERLGYLKPLIADASMNAPVTIATLNYDNTIERAARAMNKTWSYGLDRREAGFADSFQASFDVTGAEVRLLKLHGSANWRLCEGGASEHADAPPSIQVSVLSDHKVSAPTRRALIFGQHQTLSAEFPFFDAYLAFRDALDAARSVVVVGYSFRDAHVNAALRVWFASATANQLAIVDPGWSDEAEWRFRSALHVPARGMRIGDLPPRLLPIELPASSGIRRWRGS